MPWHPDVPDFITEKPRALEKIERLSPEVIHAMTHLEMEEHIEDAATGLAKAYHDKCKQRMDYGMDECVLLVAGALSQTGGSIGGEIGSLMVGKSLDEAKQACRRFFPEEES
jgi:hypothetical protein